MKRISLSIILLITLGFIATAQESPKDDQGLSLDTIRYFTEESLQGYGIPLDKRLGWIYKKGHDMDWSQDSINLEGWRRVTPNNIDTSFADEDGRIEGWFRFKFSVDEGLSKVPLFLFKTQHFAAEVYLDGQLFEKYGETGLGKEDFQEYVSEDPLYQLPIHLEPGQIHTLAVHYVDYTVFSNRYIKQEACPISPPFFYLANNKVYEDQRNTKQAFITQISGALLFFILFWSLYIVNRNKDILICSLFVSFLPYQSILWFFASMDHVTVYLSSQSIRIFRVIHFVNATIFPAILVLIASKLVINKIDVTVKVYVAALTLFALINSVIFYRPDYDIFNLGYSLFNISSALAQASGLVMLIWLLWSNRKAITGPKKILVWGYALFILISIIITCLLISGYLPSYSAMLQSLGLAGLPLLISFAIYIAQQLNEFSNQLIKVEDEKRQILSEQNATLEKQVQERTSELNQSLDDLKATQVQLIQSEKMASLGELTAGIAHEIQNPLNFVNNFSDVSGELIDEAIEEFASDELASAALNEQVRKSISEVKDILNDLKGNLGKIHHHGSRASSIVKGMLAHSRTTTSDKELTDINALCDQYMRLSYHGMRAKDKTFNADFALNLEEGLESINVIPQDLGRVILNILNNAFYTVDKKLKSGTIKDYEPMVELTTQLINESSILLSIKDNGQGMSQEVQDKIFQPFFTTKPTGQGTGLGMSISYDIITNGHGGEMKVQSEVGEGSIFTINIPI